MTERVTTEWTIEREHAERDYVRYEQYTLELHGYFSYAEATRDDPGECLLELDGATFRGTPFELTLAEEQAIIAQWTQELANA